MFDVAFGIMSAMIHLMLMLSGVLVLHYPTFHNKVLFSISGVCWVCWLYVVHWVACNL